MADELPPAAHGVNLSGRSPYVLLCEHASDLIPGSYRGLGLGAADLKRHIAWDIGAAAVAACLSRLIDAPLILSGYSRLLIDCNRPLDAPTSIPETSEATSIPGNAGLSREERLRRAERFYWPFQRMVSAFLDRRQKEGVPTTVIGMHSFTPVFKGHVRPWQAGVLFRHSRALGDAMVSHLLARGLVAAANEPYTISDVTDYTVPVHGEARGLEAVLVEIRQDLIADDAGVDFWAGELAGALTAQPASP